MSIEFKKKFSIILACYMLIISLHLPLFKVYADDEVQIYTIQTRSGTVVVSASVVSTILALATKLGVDFLTGDEMDRFVREMVADANGIRVLKGVATSLATIGAGVVGLPASVVNTFCKYLNTKRVTADDIVYYKFYDKYGTQHSIPILPNEFYEEDKYGNKGWELFRRVASIADNSTSVVFEHRNVLAYADFQFPNVSVGFRSNTDGTILHAIGFDGDTWENDDNDFMGYTRNWSSEYSRAKAFIFAEANSDGSDFFLRPGYVFYNPITGIQYGSAGVNSFPLTRYLKKDIASGLYSTPTISDKVITSPGATSIAVPKDTNDLIGKKPSDITTTPTYEVWTPGETVTPPSAQTPSVEYSPDLVVPEVIPEEKPEETPDEDTSVPGEDDTTTPSLSFDWLKELFNRLLDLIQTIIDWLTNFWDNLLEFIKSIFVPSEGYFVDVFNDILSLIKEKIPGVDVSKLEQLAVGEQEFEDIYATFFGVECLVVKGTIINRVVSWGRPIIQGIIALFLLLYNYNQIYFLFRGSRLSSNSSEKG